MKTLTQEEYVELARLHKEREALVEKMRKIDAQILDTLGLTKQDRPRKMMSSKDFVAACW